MTLPTRVVTATFQTPDEVPCSGKVTFTANVPLAAVPEDIKFPTAPVTATLDGSGHISVTLVTTDAADITPSGWTYTVAEFITGSVPRVYNIQILNVAGALDLATVAPVTTAPPVVTYVLATSVGTIGGPAGPLDSGGHVPAAQIPPLSSPLPIAQGGTASATATAARTALQAALALVPTAVKTSAYTAAAGDLVPVDTTSGAVAITLPTAPADRAVVAVKMVVQGGTNATTVTCGSGDVFNKAGGSMSLTLTLLSQAVLLQYAATPAIWYIVSDDLPLAQLDGRYVLLTGSTMTGPLKISATGNAAGSFPLGFTDAVDKGLDLIGSFTGGPGVPGTDSDSTARLNAYVYQQNQGSSGGQQGQYGEYSRAYMMKSWSHPTMAFYGPTSGFTATVNGPPVSGGDPQGNWQPVAWLGAQFTDILANGATTFKHFAIEVPDKTNGYMIGRLIFPFGDTTTALSDVGLDTTNIHTNAANFVVSGSKRFGIAGAAGTQRSLELSSETVPAVFSATKTRWKITASDTAESGTNAGSDFWLEAFSDTGVSLGKWLQVTRATGAMGLPSGSTLSIGSATALGTAARVQIQWGTGHGLLAQPTASPGTSASFASWLTATTDRTLDSRVVGDTSGRWVAYADGKQEWGPGNAGRDVNLYRSAAGVLTTDQALKIGGNVGFYGTTPVAKPTVTGSKGGNAALASLLAALAGQGILTDSST